MSSIKIFILARTDASHPSKPVVHTVYRLFPQTGEKLDPVIDWVPARPRGIAQVWAGILRDKTSRLQVIDRGLDVGILLELMKDLCLMEAKTAIENGKGDVGLDWKSGNRTARLSVKEGLVTRYVWWDVVAVKVFVA
jgi:hypothetical protein